MSVIKSGKRLWRTEDGGLVEDGDPRAKQLAYGPDDEVSEEDQKRLKGDQVDDDTGDERSSEGPFLAQHPTGTVVIRDPNSKSPPPDYNPNADTVYLFDPTETGAAAEQPPGGPADPADLGTGTGATEDEQTDQSKGTARPKAATKPADKAASAPANKGNS